MTDEIDTLRSSEDSLRAKLAEVQLQLQRLIYFETEYEATTKTSSPSVVARIAKMERQKKEMLIELGKLVYARISLIRNKKRSTLTPTPQPKRSPKRFPSIVEYIQVSLCLHIYRIFLDFSY
jgi:hypothetical protein